MNRCLHITIHEGSVAAPRRATSGLPARNGNDPRADDVVPRPDDPSPDSVTPRPDDPSPDYVTPRPDDPNAGVFSSHGSGPWGEVAATAHYGAAGPHATVPGRMTRRPFVGPRDYSGVVVVRMAPGIERGTAQTLWELARDHKLAGLKAVLELPPGGPVTSRRLVELPEPVESESKYDSGLDPIHALERKAAGTALRPLHSLTSYWRLDLREDADLVEEIVARLNGLAEVGLAYRELAASDPQEWANGEVFSEDQTYLEDAPAGIGAAWAAEILEPAPSTTHPVEPLQPAKKLAICDLEQGWDVKHQDLQGQEDLDLGPLFGLNRADHDHGSGDHGTAVLGQLAAAGANSLVQGIVAGPRRFILASHYQEDGNGNVAEAILHALDRAAILQGPLPVNEQISSRAALQPGDILLIEVQRGRLPAEVDEADFNAIRLATGLGIIVVEAAGNGGFDLDAYSDPDTGRSLRRGDPQFRDSGAILVGAARAGRPHDRAPFSNYGSRLDCFGWGEAVTTCGYGDLDGTEGKNFYTNSFAGTSSASPIIAGAAALLQNIHETRTGKRLKPQAIRELLADPRTGTRQGPNVPGNIGVRPDLKAIVRDLLQLVPAVYLRRSIGDDGTPLAAGDEISSSPDLLVSSQSLDDVRTNFGEGSPGENLAAPGGPVKANEENQLYVRLRNRGLGTGHARVRLFASPAATLITPERWICVDDCQVNEEIPQGDTLFVAEPVSWKPPSHTSLGLQADPPWSFLAIIIRPGEEPVKLDTPWPDRAAGLPPGPPYFDWAEYLAFLRGPGVAWRNTHYVDSPSPTLTFWIAGTPDCACYFDFEVIQRLPAGATVSIEPPNALAAKLRQRKPWLDSGSGTFLLPKRPRMALRGVELAAETYAEAVFRVEPADAPLKTGHSLALRQLWRGQEVGRITWLFGDRPKTLR